jgi:hypothetical protein
LFCTALGSLEASFAVVHRADLDARRGLERFLLEVGRCPRDCPDPFAAACDALAVVEKGNARMAGLRRRLRLRGEEELLSLLAASGRDSKYG